MRLKARNRLTGEVMVLEDGKWKPAQAASQPSLVHGAPAAAFFNVVPNSHALGVPGERWAEHYRAQQRAGLASSIAKTRAELDKQSVDPHYVDPPKFSD